MKKKKKEVKKKNKNKVKRKKQITQIDETSRIMQKQLGISFPRIIGKTSCKTKLKKIKDEREKKREKKDKQKEKRNKRRKGEKKEDKEEKVLPYFRNYQIILFQIFLVHVPLLNFIYLQN